MIRSSYRPIPAVYRCPCCGGKCATPQHLGDHLRASHPKALSNVRPGPPPAPPIPDPEPPTGCRECGAPLGDRTARAVYCSDHCRYRARDRRDARRTVAA